jgi:hypothetical protein
MTDHLLGKVIVAEIAALEAENELVVCSTNPNRAARRICDAVLGIVPQTGLTPPELWAVRRLILQAIDTPSFFDWEMPILTGATAEEFRAIAAKLPGE